MQFKIQDKRLSILCITRQRKKKASVSLSAYLSQCLLNYVSQEASALEHNKHELRLKVAAHPNLAAGHEHEECCEIHQWCGANGFRLSFFLFSFFLHPPLISMETPLWLTVLFNIEHFSFVSVQVQKGSTLKSAAELGGDIADIICLECASASRSHPIKSN